MRELPEGWSWRRLRDVTDNFDSKRVPLKEADRKKKHGQYPYCGANGIIDVIDDYLFDGEYLLLAEDGGYWGSNENSAYLMRERFWVNNHAHIIRAKGDVLNAYLFRALNYQDLSKYITGTTRGKLTQDSMNEIILPIPPLETQRKIVTILDKAEETKRLRAQANKLTQKMLQGVFLEIFGDPVKNPKKWKLVALDEVCPVIHRYPTFYGFDYVPTGVPVLKISNMNDEGGFNEEGFDRITDKINLAFPLTIVDEGDIIFEARGTYIGKCAVVPARLKGSNISPNTIRIGPDRSKILPEYLFSLTLTEGWKSLIENRANYWKGGFGTIKASELKSLQIPLPPINVQYGFSTTVKQVRRMRENSVESTVQTNRLVDVLTSTAFKGALVA